jgi:hypothetical protein
LIAKKKLNENISLLVLGGEQVMLLTVELKIVD